MKTKRILGLLLTICVLASSIIVSMPVSAATTGTVLYNEDFEDLTLSTGSIDKFGGSKSVFSTPEAPDTSISTPTGYGNLWGTNGTPSVISSMGYRWGSVTSGIIKMGFDFWLDKTGGIELELMYNDANYRVLLLEEDIHHTYTNTNSTKTQHTDLGNNIPREEWLSAEILINAATKTFIVTISPKDGNGNRYIGSGHIQTVNTTAPSDATKKGVHGFKINGYRPDTSGTSSIAKIDNIKVEKDYTGADQVVYAEDFNDTTAAYAANGSTTLFTFGGGGTVLRDGEKVAHIAVSQTGTGEEAATALNGKMGVRWGSVTSGKLKLTFDFQAKCSEYAFTHKLMWDDQQNNTIIIKDNKIGAAWKANNSSVMDTPIGEISEDIWYTMDYIVDADAKTFDVIVTEKETGAKVCGVYGISMQDATSAPADDRRGANGFVVQMSDVVVSSAAAGEYEYLVDNIVAVKNYTGTAEDYVIVDDNMNGLTTETLGKRSYWINPGYKVENVVNNINGIENLDDGHGTVLNISPSSGSGESGIIKRFTQASTGAYKIEMDVNASGTRGFVVYAHDKESNNNSNTSLTNLLYVVNTQAYIGKTHEEGQRELITDKVPRDEWFKVELIINLGAAGTEDDYKIAKIYKADGTLLGECKYDGLVSTNKTASINNISRIQITSWAGADKILVDNVKISRYYPVPELSADRVEITYYDDTKADNITSVKPEIKSIAFDFGCEVAEAGTVTLTENGGSAATLTGSFDANKQVYTVSTDFLKPDKKYTLEVAGFENSRGTAMETFTAEITAGAGTLFAEMSTMSASKLSDLSTGATLTVTNKYLNATEEASDLVWIMAYYSNNGTELEMTEIKKESAAALSYNNALTQTFTVKDLTGIDSVKVFLWDGTKTMIPYCEAKILD